MNTDFYPLRVLETKSEIGGQAKSVLFEIPDHLKEVFAWRAGQHLSFRFNIKGAEERRSYSISSSPMSGDPLRITVKRVQGGLVSNYINDNVKKGDTLDVMPPFGSFCLDATNKFRRTHYFFGAGSGITPLYSMIHSILQAEPDSAAYLLFGNKDEENILFNESFSKLKQEHPTRLVVNHVLSQHKDSSTFTPWRKGTVDKEAIRAFINENPPYAQDTQYYVCGPGSMNTAVTTALMGLDVPRNRIHKESYGGVSAEDDGVEGCSAAAQVTLNGKIETVLVVKGETLLNAMRKTELTPPFSCQSGACGACRATLYSGEIHMQAHMALDEEEIDRGAILTCQSIPLSEKLTIKFD